MMTMMMRVLTSVSRSAVDIIWIYFSIKAVKALQVKCVHDCAETSLGAHEPCADEDSAPALELASPVKYDHLTMTKIDNADENQLNDDSPPLPGRVGMNVAYFYFVAIHFE